MSVLTSALMGIALGVSVPAVALDYRFTRRQLSDEEKQDRARQRAIEREKYGGSFVEAFRKGARRNLDTEEEKRAKAAYFGDSKFGMDGPLLEREVSLEEVAREIPRLLRVSTSIPQKSVEGLVVWTKDFANLIRRLR